MGTLFINGTEVAATDFVYDGCHKIWLLCTDADREAMAEYGWGETDTYPVSDLPAIWDDTCPLRFIESFTGQYFIPQCEDGTVEYYEDSAETYRSSMDVITILDLLQAELEQLEHTYKQIDVAELQHRRNRGMQTASFIADAASEDLTADGYLVHKDLFHRAHNLVLAFDRIGY